MSSLLRATTPPDLPTMFDYVAHLITPLTGAGAFIVALLAVVGRLVYLLRKQKLAETMGLGKAIDSRIESYLHRVDQDNTSLRQQVRSLAERVERLEELLGERTEEAKALRRRVRELEDYAAARDRLLEQAAEDHAVEIAALTAELHAAEEEIAALTEQLKGLTPCRH